MEEIYSSTMAKVHWLNTAYVYKKDYFHDYITNAAKRFQTGTASKAGEKFWNDYGIAYKTIRDRGGLIIRAKVITDDSLTIYQIYESRKDRIDFIKQIDTELFHNVVKIKMNETEKPISVVEKDMLIKEILQSKKIIIQALREDHRVPGLVIGDPLKKEPLLLT
jgi:hypothetical protein